ncbi:hypothetical protein LX36DRAFT_663865 [Colletotrichum falcatum]|nr:hypothetical protein LX36DRAFT_663865 [Colletotrichum falcatum]
MHVWKMFVPFSQTRRLVDGVIFSTAAIADGLVGFSIFMPCRLDSRIACRSRVQPCPLRLLKRKAEGFGAVRPRDSDAMARMVITSRYAKYLVYTICGRSRVGAAEGGSRRQPHH